MRVFAVRCKDCGKLAVEVDGRRTEVIDLGKTKRKPTIASYDAHWIRRHEGKLRLVALGGGRVIVDGVGAWRTSG